MTEKHIAFPAAELGPADELDRPAGGPSRRPRAEVHGLPTAAIPNRRSGMSVISVAAGCFAGGIVLSLAVVWAQTRNQLETAPAAQTGLQDRHSSRAGPAQVNKDSSALDSGSQHAVTIRRPAGPPRVDIGLTDAQGESLEVACSTCHTTRAPNRQNKSTADLDEFHKGIDFSHGKLSCLACHNAQNYDKLQLADGAQLEFQDVMTLCSQCHGTQRRDYDHGAHGGMNGYWDLSRGPRVRNNCVDCHHPHQPKFPKMNPTFKPRDRFLEAHDEDRHE